VCATVKANAVMLVHRRRIGTGPVNPAAAGPIIRKRERGERETFNGPFSGTTQVSRYQKNKTNLDFTEARDSDWQWHQLGHVQVCTSLQTDNHASSPPLSFYRPDALPAAHQQRQSTIRQRNTTNKNFKFTLYQLSRT